MNRVTAEDRKTLARIERMAANPRRAYAVERSETPNTIEIYKHGRHHLTLTRDLIPTRCMSPEDYTTWTRLPQYVRDETYRLNDFTGARPLLPR